MERIIKRAALFTILTMVIWSFAGLALAQNADPAERSALSRILKTGVLRVGLEATYMPFAQRNSKGQIIGFDVDVAKVMAKAMKVRLELHDTAWDAIIPALITNKFDIVMSGMTITQERNLRVNFCHPYMTVGQTILVAKKHQGGIKSYQDLNDGRYIIAVKEETTGALSARKYMPKARINSFVDEQVAIMEVANGKADAFVYDHPMCAVINAKYPGKFIFLDKPFTFEPLGWAVRQGDPDFLNWLNNFLAQIKGDGTYEALYKKWFLSNEWLKGLE